MSHTVWNGLFSLRQYARERGEHHVSAVDRALRTRDYPRRRQPVDPRCGHAAIDLADRRPRTVMRLHARAAPGWGCEALGEIAAGECEHTDEAFAFVAHLVRELGDRRRRGDHRAEGSMM